MTLLTLLLLTQIPVPIIKFPVPPPLIVVEPGVQVVEDQEDEVFVHDGWYWHRRDGRWFRSRDHQGHWVVVEDRGVPAPLVRLKPGAYRHYKHEARELRREERRETRREEKEDKRERKEERREKKHGKD
ncbi:MAG: hypothetical protein IPJ65_33555 [Archangiaceae bacterium]|nr:hypothetical protein [Archangiaceae bacterium]